MKLFAALAISVVLLMGQSSQPAPHTVTAVRHWSTAGVTRIAIEVSSPFEFRTDRLHNPERVYFDILNTRPLIDSKRLYSEMINDKFLDRIRVAETNPGITRVVLELNGSVDATASTLSNPHRLMIELRTAAGTPIPTSPGGTDTPPAFTPPPVPAAPLPVPVTIAPPPVTSKPVDLTARLDPPVMSTPKEVRPADPAPAPMRSMPFPPVPEETAKAAKPMGSGANSLIRALGLKINRVVIDPGHGGHDEGTAGPKGLLEKDLVLDIAQRVGKLVQDRLNAEVIYTRTDDTFIPLEGRTELANDKKADLFLSIHANSSPVPRISGVETYYLNINGTKDAMDTAARENGASEHSIYELQDVINQIVFGNKSEESHEFAKRVQSALFPFNQKYFPANKDRGVKTAPFVVLKGAKMPSILVEIGFVSNSREEALLKKPEYRQKLAEALYKGMEKYAESLSHFQVAVKP